MIPNIESDLELGKWIWQNLVPKSGQAETVQGELLRANEKLRDEAKRNGNGNWDGGFEILLNYIEFKLCKKKTIFKDPSKKLRADITILRNYDEPYLKDDLYDRIESEIFAFCRNNKELIKHELNDELHR